MFERFSERARQVIVLAQDEAGRLGHDRIGTEHLLLGLLREEEGLAARVLEQLGVALDETRARVAALHEPGPEPQTAEKIPFTPRAKNALELALREALSLGHSYIGTEHVLLGLVRESEGMATRVLLESGVDAEAVRNAIVSLMAGMPQPAQPWSVQRQPRRRRRWDYLVVALGALDTPELVQRGAEGWELVAIVGDPGSYRGVFKRPA